MPKAPLLHSQFLTQKISRQSGDFAFGHGVSVKLNADLSRPDSHLHPSRTSGYGTLKNLEKIVMRLRKTEMAKLFFGFLRVQSKGAGRLHDTVVGQVFEQIFYPQHGHSGGF